MQQVTVNIGKNLTVNDVKDYWVELEKKAIPNVFLSWKWIGNWLSQLSSPFLLVIAEQNKSVVGLGILVSKVSPRHGVIKSKQLFLHRAGEHHLDQTWIEYNDFLIAEKDSNHIRYSIVEHIIQDLKWDEIVVGASSEDAFTPFRLHELKEQVSWASQSYQVDLKTIRDRNLSYLSTLSRNTRYQINRSIRAYEQKGPLSLRKAHDTETALTWFHEAGPLHITRWDSKKVGSGFSNPSFVQFHETLIDGNVENGLVDIFKVCAGDYVICYLYNILQEDEVKFYLSANHYEESEKNLKPGLVAHYLAIQHYMEQGLNTYDFMGGESQYKRSLSNKSSPIFLMHFQRPSLTFKIENTLRRVKHQFFPEKKSAPFEPLTFIITGGTENTSARTPQYNQAKVVLCEYQHNEPLKAKHVFNYSPDNKVQSSSTNIICKAGAVDKDTLWVPTETEVLKLNAQDLTLLDKFSHPSFNDLHHILPLNNTLNVVNTGLNAIATLDKSGTLLSSTPVCLSADMPIDSDIDYRLLSSTKPHLSHPNFAFELKGQRWITRCDLMDAICLDDRSKRINIGTGLVHDGVVFKDHVYFTTVSGFIKVFDANTFDHFATVNLNMFIPNINGWCRGILPLSPSCLLIGISKYRQSKRGRSLISSYSKVLCVDIHEQTLLWEKSTESLGVDAIFSILPGASA